MAKHDSMDELKVKIEILRGAKKLLRVRSNDYICSAILHVNVASVVADVCTWGCKEELRQYISKALGRHCYYHDWARARSKRIEGVSDVFNSSVVFRNYRMQWIDWMIDCLTKQLEKKNG